MVVLMSSILIGGANGFIGLKLLQTLTSFKNIYTISRNKLNKVDKSNIHEYRFDIGKTWSFKDHTDIILF
jgi:NAD dependent epimerase/dehydratase family enzyme